MFEQLNQLIDRRRDLFAQRKKLESKSFYFLRLPSVWKNIQIGNEIDDLNHKIYRAIIDSQMQQMKDCMMHPGQYKLIPPIDNI